jgi:transposase InsO family protein
VRRIFEARPPAARRKDERGPEAQEVRRELERTMRRRAVALARWTRRAGLETSDVAELLGISERTLREWKTGWEKDRLRAKPVGRHAYRADRNEREAIVAMLGVVGPGVAVRELQELFPKASRRELAGILEGYRDDWTKSREKVVMALRWKRTGRVWAMDFTDPPVPVDGEFPKILVIRDLASGYLLLALPSRDATAAVVRAALVAVLLEVDAPLVLKTDNGSHFTAWEIRELLAARGIVHLVSPPGTPRYNGAVEAGIGSLKTRAHFESARRGRPGEWTCDDVEAARRQANAHGRPRGFEGDSPDVMWYERERVYDNERDDFRCRVEELRAEARRERGYLPGLPLPVRQQDDIDRVAISRACVALGYLCYRRKRIPIRVSDLKRRKIS